MDDQPCMPAHHDDGTQHGQSFLEGAAEKKRGKKKSDLRDDEGRKKSQATVLTELCGDLELFHDQDSTGYAVLKKSQHREVWPIQSRAFRGWLSHEYFQSTGQGARGAAVADALATVEAKSLHQAPQRDVFMRVAWLDDRILIDLADEEWRVVEIDADGWRIRDDSPVMFVRRTGMAAIAVPMAGGKFADLGAFINVSSGDLPLILGWLLMAARGRGPYPVLILNGEQGCGKSTTTRALRAVIDPSSVPLRGLTRDVRDLMVTATNNHVVIADNLSGLSAELSDVFCRLATGGGFAERQLYTNRDEVIINLQRPIILNGIDEVASRGDLMERSLIMHLPVIKDTTREDESAFWKRFDAALPGIVGGLCDVLSCAIKNQHTIKLPRKPRMADFALWVTAAEPAMGLEPGSFMKAYSANQDAGVEVALDASPFGEALLKYLGSRTAWTGTATDLLNELERTAHDRALRAQSWPKSGKGAASALRRLAPLFRRRGITITQDAREAHTGRRLVVIEVGFSASPSSPDEKNPREAPIHAVLAGDDCRSICVTQPSPGAFASPVSHPIVTPNPSTGAACDDGDDGDAKKPGLNIPDNAEVF